MREHSASFNPKKYITFKFRTGFGKMVYPDGAAFSGTWENGVHVAFRSGELDLN